MYRQVDSHRNEKSVKADKFPDHITSLMNKLREEEETRANRSSSVRHRPIADLTLPEQIVPLVYFYNPKLKKLKMTRVYISQKFCINTVLETAYQMLSVEQFATLANCRLVVFDPASERIIRSLENDKDPSLSDIKASSEDTSEFLLEYKGDGQEFEAYEPGGTTWYVYTVNLNGMEMDGPYFVYSHTMANDETLKHSIALRLHLKKEELIVVTTKRYKKAFITCNATPTKDLEEQLQQLVKTQFKDITYLFLNVPNTQSANLEIIGIPANSKTTEQQEQDLTPRSESAPALLPALDTTDGCGEFLATQKENQHSNGVCSSFSASPMNALANHLESNSEDSSLSDGDRTLVENIQSRGTTGGGDSQISSTSHSPQLSSPEDENRQDSINRVNAFYNGYSHSDDMAAQSLPEKPQFFHAIQLAEMDTSVTSSTRNRHTYSDAITDAADDIARKPVVTYKILVDSHMKMSVFKQNVEQLIKVPSSYFQLTKKHDKNLNMWQSLLYFGDGESLNVQLGRELESDEYRSKVYFMRLAELTNEVGSLPFVCEWIFKEATTVAEAKAILISKLQRIDSSKYQTLKTENCRLWLKGGRSPIKIFKNETATLVSDILSSAPMEVSLNIQN